ncbi:MAG: hypothetical protein KJ000_05255 [Pirellulaceae bacterium]|nr:hypothetical protein [Pirellulaceae bacterium]
MNLDAVESLTRELSAMTVGDEQSWLEYIPLAARLAALGEPGFLGRWTELARPFSSRLESLLIERSEEGLWDLQQSVGQDIALAIIDAQDFYCFLRREKSILPKAGKRLLGAWIKQAERTALDEDAVVMLRRFLRRFPLPPSDRLTIVDTPMSLTEEAILAAVAAPCQVIELSWPAPVSTLIAAEPFAQYDAGTPSDRLKQQFARLDVPVEIPGAGGFTLSRRIDDRWRVVIDIDREDGRVPPVDLVRLGKLPGRPARDAIGRWLIDLRPWEHIQRTRLMHDSPLVIGFQNGYRLRVT